jgi:hypothetical protein
VLSAAGGDVPACASGIDRRRRLTSSSSAQGPQPGAPYTDGRYLVTFADEPGASYDGYGPGFAATGPSRAEARREQLGPSIEDILMEGLLPGRKEG